MWIEVYNEQGQLVSQERSHSLASAKRGYPKTYTFKIEKKTNKEKKS